MKGAQVDPKIKKMQAQNKQDLCKQMLLKIYFFFWFLKARVKHMPGTLNEWNIKIKFYFQPKNKQEIRKIKHNIS